MLRQSILLAAMAGAAALFGNAVAPSDTAATRLAEAGAPGLSCEIAADRQGGAALLTGTARIEGGGAKSAEGDFRFTVTSTSPGGSSRSAQNGTFAVERGKPAVLGEIGLSGDADYEASLVLTVEGRDVTCRAES